MERDDFIFDGFCEFLIVSEEVDPDTISEKLNIAPDRSFRKGDRSISAHSGTILTKPHHLWAIRSANSITDEEAVSQHIEQLRIRLLPGEAILKEFRADPRLEATFMIRMKTNSITIGFDLSEAELDLVYGIANRLRFSLHTDRYM